MKMLSDKKQLNFIMEQLLEVAKLSTCHRSKCGSVIVIDSHNVVIGKGYNSMPCNLSETCFKDTLAKTFKSDRTCCIHAEQRAIMNVLANGYKDILSQCSIYFIRLDNNGNPIPAGKPYCSICSKMALDAGIAYFCLWHETGWVQYKTTEYNSLTYQYK